jgi:general secretion pathway protein B
VSLILDALNRSREDANPVPGLTTHHRVEEVAVNRRQYLLWVALSVAVVLIAWLFMERYSAPQPARETAEIREAAEQETPPMADSTPAVVEIVRAVPTAQEPTAIESIAAVEASPPLVEEVSTEIDSQSVSAAAAPQVQVQVPAPALPANDAVAQLYQNPGLAEEPVVRKPQRQPDARSASGTEPRDEPIDVDKLIKLARAEAKNSGVEDHSVPFLIDLSQQIKDTVPTIHYLRHDYSSDTSRSTVVLNSKTLSVGGTPAMGMKVEEILPDSVVLNYQGTQFRLRALNSWINL